MNTTTTTLPSTATPQPDEEALLHRAMEELDAELTAKRDTQDQEELARTNDLSLMPDIVDNVQQAIGGGAAKAIFEAKDFLLGEPLEADKSALRKSIEAKDRALDRQSVGYGLTSGITQFATGLVGAGKLMAPIKAAQKLAQGGKAARTSLELAKGAATGAVVIDPHEERLSDLVEEFPALRNPVTEYLAADPSDSAAEGRFKNALEGIGLDLAIVGTFATAGKALKLFRAGDEAGAKTALGTMAPKSKAPTPSTPGAQPSSTLEAATGTRTGPVASAASPTPANAPEAASELPGVEERRIEFEERAAILEFEEGLPRVEAERRAADETGYRVEDNARATSPSGETNQSGGSNPDPSPSVLEAAPSSTTTRRPQQIDVTPEALDEILKAIDADLKAITRYGSREAALEAGEVLSRGSKLPWQKLRASDEVKTFVENAARTIKTQMDARKGGDIMSDASVSAMVQARAELFGEDPALVMGQLAEAGEQAAHMVSHMEASYLIANRMMQEAYDVAFKVRNGMLDEWGGDAAEAGSELRARLTASADLIANARSISSNSGRALRRLRGQFQVRPEDLAKVKGMDPNQLAELIYSTKGDPRKLAQAANPGFLRRVMDEATNSLTNSLLWLYPTHLVNMTSSIYMLAARPTEKLIGSFAIGPKAGGDVLRQQAMKEYAYTVAALSDGATAMVEAFKRGDSILSPHNTEFFTGGTARTSQKALPWKPAQGIWDIVENAWMAANYRTIIGLPTRTLGAADEFFKTLRYRAVVQAEAATKANVMGLSGEDFRQYVNREMEAAIDPATGQALNRKALQEAQVTTFQQELLQGTAGATIQQVRTRHPILTFVLPFVKTPVNVLRYGWRMSPGLNLLQKEFREALSGIQGAEAQAHAAGQMALGTVFMGLAATLAMNGKMTGSGPTDPRLQQQLRATGWQPNSYVLEDGMGGRRYIPMGRFDPPGMVLSMVANLVDVMRLNPYGETQDAEAGIGALSLALAKNFTDRTFLQNLHQALEALTDPGARGEKYLGTIAGNTIPLSSALRGLNPDPYLREAQGFIDTMLKNLPGYSETLPPSRDVFGEPMWKCIGITTMDEADAVEAEHNRIILETGKGIGRPDPNFHGVDLRDITLKSGQNAYDRLQELSGELPRGKSLKARLAEVIRTETYRDLPDGEASVKGTRLNMLGKIVAQYREAARKVLLVENAELRPLITQRQRDARAAFLQSRKDGSKAEPARSLLDALRGGNQ